MVRVTNSANEVSTGLFLVRWDINTHWCMRLWLYRISTSGLTRRRKTRSSFFWRRRRTSRRNEIWLSLKKIESLFWVEHASLQYEIPQADSSSTFWQFYRCFIHLAPSLPLILSSKTLSSRDCLQLYPIKYSLLENSLRHLVKYRYLLHIMKRPLSALRITFPRLSHRWHRLQWMMMTKLSFGAEISGPHWRSHPGTC